MTLIINTEIQNNAGCFRLADIIMHNTQVCSDKRFLSYLHQCKDKIEMINSTIIDCLFIKQVYMLLVFFSFRRHDIDEILLKLALNTNRSINLIQKCHGTKTVWHYNKFVLYYQPSVSTIYFSLKIIACACLITIYHSTKLLHFFVFNDKMIDLKQFSLSSYQIFQKIVAKNKGHIIQVLIILFFCTFFVMYLFLIFLFFHLSSHFVFNSFCLTSVRHSVIYF